MTSLELTGVVAGYVGTDVLRDVDVTLAPGETVVVLGPNGAGKSTLLRVASGQLPLRSGTRRIRGEDATNWNDYEVARAGIRWVGEPRPIYPSMTVRENLTVGGFQRHATIDEELERVYGLLPILRDRAEQAAGYLSGGQQQMLAIGQALMSRPKFVCLDEPSLGLAPSIVTQVGDFVADLAKAGVGVLWAEQFPEVALSRADRVLVMAAGRVVHRGPASGVTSADLESAYLGH